MIVKNTLLGRSSQRIPIWFMRQAGRYLPEYMEIRKNYPDFLHFCYTPKDACEVTLQPLRRFDLDAAIIFSDILVIPDALGQKVTFEKNHGPVLVPFNFKAYQEKSWDSIQNYLSPVYEAITLTRGALPSDKALFGFAGTPWTLSCYMLNEGKSDNFHGILNYVTIPHLRPILDQLLDLLTNHVAHHLIAQAKAGCDVLQLFDSWAIKAPHNDWDGYLIQPFLKIAEKIHQYDPKIPLVYYSRCPMDLYDDVLNAMKGYTGGPVALGVWQGEDISTLRQKADGIPLQGNLDPELLLKGGDSMIQNSLEICDAMKDYPFVFNLGHGIIKETSPDNVTKLIQSLRSISL